MGGKQKQAQRTKGNTKVNKSHTIKITSPDTRDQFLIGRNSPVKLPWDFRKFRFFFRCLLRTSKISYLFVWNLNGPNLFIYYHDITDSFWSKFKKFSCYKFYAQCSFINIILSEFGTSPCDLRIPVYNTHIGKAEVNSFRRIQIFA